jgi:MerR family mercuric resistance operon transcriptional regulator
MVRIGEVAKESQVSVEAIRFYERVGLITAPGRSACGYRQYSESAIRQIQFIQHAKRLGFSLKEISELIKLKDTRNASCASVKSTAKARIADIQQKIDDLERMKSELQPLIAQCKASDPISDCPILGALDEDTDLT